MADNTSENDVEVASEGPKEEEDDDDVLLLEKDGFSLKSSTLRLLDLIAYLLSSLPFCILIGFVSLDAQIACWVSLACCGTLLAIDYFRVRFARFQPMRVPDVIPAWTFLTSLGLGIVSVTKPNSLLKFQFGPILVSVLLFGVVLSYLFREAYPLHSVDR